MQSDRKVGATLVARLQIKGHDESTCTNFTASMSRGGTTFAIHNDDRGGGGREALSSRRSRGLDDWKAMPSRSASAAEAAASVSHLIAIQADKSAAHRSVRPLAPFR